MTTAVSILEPLLNQPVATAKRSWSQLAFELAILAAALFVTFRYRAVLDAYEVGITIGTGLGICALARQFAAVRPLVVAVAVLSLSALWLYGGDLASGDRRPLLHYLLGSEAAILWMSGLFIAAHLAYLLHWLTLAPRLGTAASGLTWGAIAAGLTGLMVRWHESYLLSPEIGHIPISNLYDVFILFCLTTGLIYLHYESRYAVRTLGAPVMSIVTAAVGFLLWYTFARGAHEIQPLVPALNSYWMKIHVPANFIGYGCFALAAMVSVAYLLRDRPRVSGLVARLPVAPAIDDLAYKAIALGFAFFTVATILGALWAAEAWGGYWSWDPKETWALIVWLNYAAWLHQRIAHGRQGRVMAWWAVAGLLVTLFAFLGVNLWLSGLHSYGGL